MNAVSQLVAVEPFNPMAAYEREREHGRKIEGQLTRACLLLRLACDRGQVVDRDAVRAFLRECAQ